jgi:hypothetical protein
MCVDYQELKKRNLKDKFPFVIDDLLNWEKSFSPNWLYDMAYGQFMSGHMHLRVNISRITLPNQIGRKYRSGWQGKNQLRPSDL